MPCPLMEASSHGKEGNQINCMSVNRITSSLTCSESKLKLVTNACRSEGMGEARREGIKEEEKDSARGFPRGGVSLLHTACCSITWMGKESPCNVMYAYRQSSTYTRDIVLMHPNFNYSVCFFFYRIHYAWLSSHTQALNHALMVN